VIDVLDDAGGVTGDGLLILGEPGAGKTTLLVELAAQLADRAELDASQPLPLYLPLSTWAIKKRPLGEWVVEQLDRLYKIAPEIGRRLLERERAEALLLLDGLDEMTRHEARGACVREINRFSAEYPLALIVSSRRTEYEALWPPLQLETAVLVRPLAPDLVIERLQAHDAQGVLAIVEEDPSILELLTSPLLLSMLTLAYSGRAAEDIPLRGPPDERLSTLIHDYVERRFELERLTGGANDYPPERTVHWLKTLATGLDRYQQSIFLIERLRADVLPSPYAARLVRMAPKVAFGFGAGVITAIATEVLAKRLDYHEIPLAQVLIWILFGVAADAFQPLRFRTRLACWTALAAATGIAYGLLLGVDAEGVLGQCLYYLIQFAAIGELLVRLLPPDLPPAERLSWSWPRTRPYIVRGLLGGIVAGSVFGWLFTMTIRQQGGDIGGHGYWLIVFGPTIGLLWAGSRGVGRGLEPVAQEARNRPNEGIRQSARNGLLVALATLALVTATVVLGFAAWALVHTGDEEGGFINALVLSIAWGAGCGLLLGLASGGGAALQHTVLRVFLWRHGLAPLRYTRWLGYGIRLRLLYWGIGGGHRFIHRVVQDHFASSR